MDNKLALETGIDIPFQQAGLIIHQPSFEEIAYMGGEKPFRMALSTLLISINNFSAEVKRNLEGLTNFDILMSMMKNQDVASKQDIIHTKMLLSLLFPNYTIAFKEAAISFCNPNNGAEMGQLNSKCFGEFQNILREIFCLKAGSQEYNPAGDLAKQIADKLMKGRQKVAQQKAQSSDQKDNIYSTQISVLSVGLQISQRELSKYTIYQLSESFDRFILKTNNGMQYQAKIAGAKGIDKLDNWMDEITFS